MNRRKFLQFLAALGCSPWLMSPVKQRDARQFGQVTLMHFTDCHAQLLPMYYREPSLIVGTGAAKQLPPYLAGQAMLDFFGIAKGSADAYALSSVNFAEAARVFGKMGGFAHLSTLVKQIREARGHENTLLLDGGDTWQGSATALWTQGADMVAACNLLGVEVMTGHWEFTYGDQRVQALCRAFKGDFVAQNIRLTEEAQFAAGIDSDQVFKPYVIKRCGQARIAVIGQAFPYTPIANPRRFVPDWRFGIEEVHLQALVDGIRQRKEAGVIVLLAHNGMAVDLQLAARVTGIDVILGGHSHDALPRPVVVKNAAGSTWVTNAGSHGKFLAVLDLDIANGRLQNLRYQLQPIFANLLPPDAAMQQLITDIRQPYLEKLRQPLAVTEQLLYRRDTYHGSFDGSLLAALLAVNDAEIALSPGFRWGGSLLPGDVIHYEDVLNQTAITYPNSYVRLMSGRDLQALLEDVADNVFNQDPYYQQGGDMVRVGGISYRCQPEAAMGRRISELRWPDGSLLAADKLYKVAGWAGVGEPLAGLPMDELVCRYLRQGRLS